MLCFVLAVCNPHTYVCVGKERPHCSCHPALLIAGGHSQVPDLGVHQSAQTKRMYGYMASDRWGHLLRPRMTALIKGQQG